MITIVSAVVAGAAAAAAAVLALAPSHDDRREGATCAVAVAVASPAAPSQECAVCLSALAGAAGCSGSAAAVRKLPGCGHGFHAECIGKWLPLRPECPLCRCPVLAPEADADGQPATTAVVPAVEATPADWSRPARIACGFGDGRVVWTRSPPARATVTDGVTQASS